MYTMRMYYRCGIYDMFYVWYTCGTYVLCAGCISVYVQCAMDRKVSCTWMHVGCLVCGGSVCAKCVCTYVLWGTFGECLSCVENLPVVDAV